MKSTQIKKPFGLTLACKIAAEALHQNIAPASTIVGNLFFLQTSEHFPKDLEVYFFSTPKRILTESEKKTIGQILPELKKPSFQIPDILENYIKDNWVKKVPLQQPVKKTVAPKKKVLKKPIVQNTTIPVVVVKKNKLS